MSVLNITRPPQYTDPWFAEIEQVWDELELANNDIETRVTTLETTIANDVVTSISKSGSPQLKGDVTLTQNGTIVLTQVGNNIEVGGGGATDHGALTGLLDDDHTQYLLANGTRSLGGNWSIANYELLNVRVENLVADPAAGNQGRLIFNTTDLLLKVDDGSTFSVIGVTDHGLLTGLGDDDHVQYLLADGSRDCTGDFTVLGKYKGPANSSIVLESQEDDVPTVVAHILDTANLLTDSGAKLLSVRNQGVEKFYIDKDGNAAVSQLASTGSTFALIDTDNDSSTEVFSVRMDSPSPGSATELFSVEESGNAWLLGGMRLGAIGTPTDTLDVDGTANISGDVLFGGLLKSNSNFIMQVDADNDESAEFTWRDGLGADIAALDEAGNFRILTALRVGGLSTPTEALNVVGNAELTGNLLFTGVSPYISSTNSLLFRVDSDNDEAAVFDWRNGLDLSVMTLTEAGDLTLTGILIGGSSPFKFKSNTKANEGAKATGSITIISNAFDTGDSVTITDPSLVPTTFVETTDFAIGVDADATAINLASAINTAAIGLAATAVLNVVNLEANDPGTIGNSFALSEFDQATDNFTLSGANLTGGTDVAAVAYELDTLNSLALAGSKLFVLKNQGVEKFAIDKDGNIVSGGLSSATSVSAFIDNDNDSTSETFTVYHNVTVATPGSELFQVKENGELVVFGGIVTPETIGMYIDSCNDYTYAPGYEEAYIDISHSTPAHVTMIAESNGQGDAGFEIWGNPTAPGAFMYVNDQVGSEGRAEVGIFNQDNTACNRTDVRANIIAKGYIGIASDGSLFGANALVTPSKWRFESGAVDGASAIAYELDTQNTIANATAKLLSFKNNTVEKAYLNKAGGFWIADQLWVNATDASSGGGIIKVGNGGQTGQGIWFDVNDSVVGAALIDAGDYARIRLESTPTTAKVQVSPKINVPAGSIVFAVENNTGGVTLLNVYGNGDLEITGTLIGGSSPFKMRSKEADSGTAKAYELDTQNALSTTGAKLFVLKNNGVEKFSVDKDGIATGGGYVTVVKPAEGGAGIQAAINAVHAAGGGIVQLLKGIYTLSASIVPTIGLENVTLRGVGDATILNHDGSSGFIGMHLTSIGVTSSLLSAPALQGELQVTFTTLANAALVTAGDMIQISGTPDDGLNYELEVNEASGAGSGITGIVPLKYPIRRNITSPTAVVKRGGKNIRLESFRFTSSAPFAAVTAIQLSFLRYAQIEKVTVDSLDAALGFQMSGGWRNKVNNCTMRDFTGTSFGMNISTEIEHTISNCSITNISNQIRHVYGCQDAVIENNRLFYGTTGIEINALSSGVTRRVKISDNKLSEFLINGIMYAAVRDGVISDNTLDKCATRQVSGDSFAIECNALRNVAITGNSIRYARQGIQLGLVSESCTISGNTLTDIVGAPTTAYGLAIQASGNDLTVTGNSIRNCTKAGSTALLMYGVVGSGNGNICSNNIVDGCAGVGIVIGNDSGTGVGNTIMGNVCKNITGAYGLQINNNIADSIIIGNNCIGEGISEGTGTGNDFIGNKE